MSDKRIIVYSLEQARAAVDAAAALGVPVKLMSARGMASFMGPLWFKALCDEAVSAHPEAAMTAVLDCADEAGTVLAALRCGFKLARFTGPEDSRARLDDIAGQMDAAVEGIGAGDALDLLDCKDPVAVCRAFLRAD